MKFQDKLLNDYRLFLVPLDHPMGEDTKKLANIGVQGFVNQFDHLEHDGYIFHSRSYVEKPILTNKDSFLTVGEAPDKYLCDISKFEKLKQIRSLTIFYEVQNETDISAYDFYQDYVRDLKKLGYYVLGMGFPSENVTECTFYQHIADIAIKLGCDAFKTDYFTGVENLNIDKMKLFIGGGPYISDEKKFNHFVNQVVNLKTASFSFGRNIFESDNPIDRIKYISNMIR